jgi:hypothetical protein
MEKDKKEMTDIQKMMVKKKYIQITIEKNKEKRKMKLLKRNVLKSIWMKRYIMQQSNVQRNIK